MRQQIMSFFQCGHCEVTSSLFAGLDGGAEPMSPDPPSNSSASNPFLLHDADAPAALWQMLFVYAPCSHVLCQITDPEWIAEQDASRALDEEDLYVHDKLLDQLQGCVHALTSLASRTNASGGEDEAWDGPLGELTSVLTPAETGVYRMRTLLKQDGARFVWDATNWVVGKYLGDASMKIRILMGCIASRHFPGLTSTRPALREIYGQFYLTSEEDTWADELTSNTSDSSLSSRRMTPPKTLNLSPASPRSQVSLTSPASASPCTLFFFPHPYVQPIYSPITGTLQQVEDKMVKEYRDSERAMRAELRRAKKDADLFLGNLTADFMTVPTMCTEKENHWEVQAGSEVATNAAD